MKAAAIIVALCLGLAAAHTQEEIERKGAEVMEEYRRDRGHWVFLNAVNMVDHMTDHLGKNGLAVAGFFITKKYYGGNVGPGTATQARDPLFKEFKTMAEQQGKWLPANLRHKTWTFGYGHDKDIAMNVGCDDIGTWEWNHACVVVWRSSTDGARMSTQHSTHFGHDHSKDITPTPADLRKFIISAASKAVATHGAEL